MNSWVPLVLNALSVIILTLVGLLNFTYDPNSKFRFTPIGWGLLFIGVGVYIITIIFSAIEQTKKDKKKINKEVEQKGKIDTLLSEVSSLKSDNNIFFNLIGDIKKFADKQVNSYSNKIKDEGYYKSIEEQKKINEENLKKLKEPPVLLNAEEFKGKEIPTKSFYAEFDNLNRTIIPIVNIKLFIRTSDFVVPHNARGSLFLFNMAQFLKEAKIISSSLELKLRSIAMYNLLIWIYYEANECETINEGIVALVKIANMELEEEIKVNKG
jgi:hypothetical protein